MSWFNKQEEQPTIEDIRELIFNTPDVNEIALRCVQQQSPMAERLKKGTATNDDIFSVLTGLSRWRFEDDTVTDWYYPIDEISGAFGEREYPDNLTIYKKIKVLAAPPKVSNVGDDDGAE